MSKVFAIYPLDKSSSNSFLNRIHTFETKMLRDDWHCFKIHFSDEEHEKSIKSANESHFVLFMGHGGDTQLHGACGKYGELTCDAIAGNENPQFYDKEVFIDTSNIGRFHNQIFFCFSCNSNKSSTKSLSRLAIANGVQTFVGFGNIPTDYVEGVKFSKRCIAFYKGIIVKIIKYSIFYAVENNETVDNLVQIIKLLTTKEIQSLEMQRPFHDKDAILNQLYKFKNDIRIYGDRYAKIY
ncbi:MAG: hypothetical protein MJZ65_04275 [Paludibacteraceae bacterium]|nr:hypothetical protein [Paludibacteraceae bacterium]